MFNNIITKNSLKDSIEREGNEQKKSGKRQLRHAKLTKVLVTQLRPTFRDP